MNRHAHHCKIFYYPTTLTNVLSILSFFHICSREMQDKIAEYEALILDPENVKAFYRRSKCRSTEINAGSEEFKLALKDLKLAHEISPKENSIM